MSVDFVTYLRPARVVRDPGEFGFVESVAFGLCQSRASSRGG
jgi:hypothetical protein